MVPLVEGEILGHRGLAVGVGVGLLEAHAEPLEAGLGVLRGRQGAAPVLVGDVEDVLDDRVGVVAAAREHGASGEEGGGQNEGE